MSKISLIVAMDENDLIGRDNDLPWRLSNDLRHFKQVTMGKPLVMGRKCFESIGKPLPGRRNIVLTRDPVWQAQGVEVANDFEQALSMTADVDEVMIIGGAQIYAQALERVECIYLTRIHASFEGDTYFPAVDWQQWEEITREEHLADERNTWAHSFITLERGN
ncbi:MAG: dihydrofolate reductase [Salinisphaeraceae bacterium]|nr:dihydrofolate reductase [Salinisphaeraceae bacterium]